MIGSTLNVALEDMRHQEIADMHEINQSNVIRLDNGERWSHLGGL